MVVPPSTGAATSNPPPSTNRPPARSNNSHSSSYAHNVPLSARRSAPLDISTVERRDQPNASREPVKRVRPHGLQEAPTFRPTEEEFKDPMEYMRKIAPEGSKYGICRVIPPDSWNPPFAIDTEVRTLYLNLLCLSGPQETPRHMAGLPYCPVLSMADG